MSAPEIPEADQSDFIPKYSFASVAAQAVTPTTPR
jgi:hypothetical protein